MAIRSCGGSGNSLLYLHCENALLGSVRLLAVHGSIRLGICFAQRSRYFAQDDNVAGTWEWAAALNSPLKPKPGSSEHLLVFPVISGTFFNATDLGIHLDLSNKNAGSKISYSVDTQYGECDITALFVPTIEIARTFHRYKNSILRFNPRSYLELEGAKVNAAIRNTIFVEGKNEFALCNNGITMLSDRPASRPIAVRIPTLLCRI
jgi:hypothetical protein